MRTKPLSVAVEKYLASRKEPPCVRGARRFRSVPKSLGEFLKREATTAALTAETARQWLTWRAETVNAQSVRHDSRALVTVWRWCYRRHYAGEPSTYFEIQPGGYRRYRPRGCPDAEPGTLSAATKRKMVARLKPKKAPPRPDAGWRGLLSRVFG